MKHRTKLFLVAFAMIIGTLLLMAGVGGTGPRYVGRFFGDGTGLSNSVDIVAGPNINVTPGPGNRAYTIESTAAGAAGIFTNSIMGYGDQYRTNYVRINTNGLTVTGGSLISDRLVVLDGAASNYIAGDITMVGSMTVDGVIASGTIFTSDVFEGNGVSLTNLNGTEIRSGTVADARIASTIARDSEVTTATQNSTNAGNIAFLPADNVFTGTSNHFNGAIGAASFTGSGAGLTNLPGYVNVMDFGAENDGSPDATDAIQMALNYARTNDAGRRVVFMPAGNYRVDGTMWIPTGVTLQGEARGAYSTIINKNFTGPAIAITNGYCAVRHLQVSTDDGNTTDSSGVETSPNGDDQTDEFIIEDVFASGFKNGIYIRNSWTGAILDCTVRDNWNGVTFTNTVNAVRIVGGHFAANTNGIWMDLTTSAENTIQDASIEGNYQRGIYVMDLRGPLNIRGNYFEVNGGSGIYTNGYDIEVDANNNGNLVIDGNYFHGTHTNLFIKDAPGTVIKNNRFVGGGGSYTNDTFIVADAGCYGMILEGNSIEAAGTNYLSDAPSLFMVQTNVVLKGGTYTGNGSGLTNSAGVSMDSLVTTNDSRNITFLGPSNRVNNLWGDNMNFSGTLSAGSLVVTNPPAMNLANSTNWGGGYVTNADGTTTWFNGSSIWTTNVNNSNPAISDGAITYWTNYTASGQTAATIFGGRTLNLDARLNVNLLRAGTIVASTVSDGLQMGLDNGISANTAARSFLGTAAKPFGNIHGTNVSSVVVTVTNVVVFYETAPTFPTNNIPPSSASATNWAQLNYGGLVRLIATNYANADVGSFLKLVGETVSDFVP